jgi:O-acetyl-ADP-ribose deacetylase (regulator of RNase III)
MIKFTSGNTLHADVEALINTVNCVGIMGRGIALQFKNAYPDNFKSYEVACRRELVQPGRMFVFETGELGNPKFIINFPTKRHWKGKSRIEDIDAGLMDLARVINERDIRSVAVPPLGSGLGGLNWVDVRPRIEAALSGLDGVSVLVYEPSGATAADTMVHRRDIPKMTEGRAALVGLMSRYLNALLEPFVSLLEVHKLMYFMQEAGQPLKLKYRAAHYGPYAENLTFVLREIEGHMVSGYADGGDSPDKPLEVVPGAVDDADSFLRSHGDTRDRFDRVADLVQGFESPDGLELLATVHWVAKGATSEKDVVNRVQSWNERKRQQFTPRQIGVAMDVLSSKGWIQSLALGHK